MNAKPRISADPHSTSSVTSINGAKAASAVSLICSRLGRCATLCHTRQAPRMSVKLSRTLPTAGRGMTTDWKTSYTATRTITAPIAIWTLSVTLILQKP